MEIPPETASLPPLMYKLRIFNLVPLDGDRSFSEDAAEKIQKEIDAVGKKFVFTAKVQMAFNDMLS